MCSHGDKRNARWLPGAIRSPPWCPPSSGNRSSMGIRRGLQDWTPMCSMSFLLLHLRLHRRRRSSRRPSWWPCCDESGTTRRQTLRLTRLLLERYKAWNSHLMRKKNHPVQLCGDNYHHCKNNKIHRSRIRCRNFPTMYGCHFNLLFTIYYLQSNF